MSDAGVRRSVVAQNASGATPTIQPLFLSPALQDCMRVLRESNRSALDDWPKWLQWLAWIGLVAWSLGCLPINIIRYHPYMRKGAREEDLICKEVVRQLSERPPRSNSDIGRPECDEMNRRVFLALEKIILNQMGWPRTQLTWDDPAEPLFYEHTSDMGATSIATSSTCSGSA